MKRELTFDKRQITILSHVSMINIVKLRSLTVQKTCTDPNDISNSKEIDLKQSKHVAEWGKQNQQGGSKISRNLGIVAAATIGGSLVNPDLWINFSLSNRLFSSGTNIRNSSRCKDSHHVTYMNIVIIDDRPIFWEWISKSQGQDNPFEAWVGGFHFNFVFGWLPA